MRSRLLVGSLYVIAVGILTQAMLAGLFISGTPAARITHVVVGAILPYLAIVPVVSTWRQHRRGNVSRAMAWSATGLMVGLWVQEVLGHMPFPVTTVIHVPFGVALFGLSVILALKVPQTVFAHAPNGRPVTSSRENSP